MYERDPKMASWLLPMTAHTPTVFMHCLFRGPRGIHLDACSGYTIWKFRPSDHGPTRNSAPRTVAPLGIYYGSGP